MTIEQVRDALAHMAAPAFADVEIVRQLGEGPTNKLWLIRCDEMDCVLRQVKPLASAAGLSLARELRVAKIVARANLAPQVIAANAERGLVLTRFAPGRTWCAPDMHEHGQLTRLAAVLRQLHALPCDSAPMNFGTVVNEYAQRSGDSRASGWRDEALKQLERIGPRTPVICHNDLTAANVIDDGCLQFIDWEFTAAGDPLFDLAVVVAHHELDAAAAAHFLAAYLGRQDDAAAVALQRWCSVYRSVRALWESLD